ncbi:MAG: glutathione-regulated potassium-efflux system protein KefC [Candidatus Sedimenticola sp. (ex Thyasira tokunagai)]
MADHSLLVNAITYLGAAVVAVPLAKRLGLGSVLGYLMAGIVIGPWGLSLIANVDDILHFAEFGVVLLLFLIGLELNPKRLWAMRQPIFGMGGMQVALTTLVLSLCGWLLGLPAGAALVVAMGLSLSSTAIALQTLTEKNLLSTHAGRSAFSVLLFQDIAVIPMMALIPLLGVAATSGGDPVSGLLKVIAAIGGIVILGHYLTRPIFHYIAQTRLPEIFTAFALLLVIGIALLMVAVDLSMALGTFLAGVLLAESEYRHELEAEIAPFKGLLLGLFFISVGMSIDFGILLERPLLIIGLVIGLVLIKLAVLWGISSGCKEPIPLSQRPLFAFLLCQGGEFAFVLFSVARGAGALETRLADPLFVVVALSMVTTPLLLILYERTIAPRFADMSEEQEDDTVEEEGNPVIIAGFGRFGRVVGRLLTANRIPTTILDHDPDRIEMVRRFDYKVYYGNATRHATLHAAGAAKAKLLIVTVDDPAITLQVVETTRKHFPKLRILARAQDMDHAFELQRRGVELFQRELLESALLLGEDALKQLGFGAYRAKKAAHAFRDHDRSLCDALYEADALEKHISITRQAREELEQVLSADAEELGRRRNHGWD